MVLFGKGPLLGPFFPAKSLICILGMDFCGKIQYNMHILVAENGRMAIHTMCGLCTWYNMHMLVAENGRMAIHTMCGLCTWYNDKMNYGRNGFRAAEQERALMEEEKLPDFHQMHFNSIQVLRGITAIFILLEHIRFLNCGAFGVDIFFCISGFMIMFSTHKDSQHFLSKRLIRILPLYYLMTTGTFVLLLLFPSMFEQTKAHPAFLLKSLFFVPFDIGGGVLQPLMRIGWTVNCELFFYFLFGIALRISHRFRGLFCGIFLIATVIIARLVPAPPAPLDFYGNPVMLEFIYGIIAYYAAWEGYRLYQAKKLPRICLPLGVLSVLGCFCWLLVMKPCVNILGFRRPLLWGLPALLIVLCAFLTELFAKKMPSPLIRLGDISFSFYLMHYYPVMLLDRVVFDFSVCSLRALAGTAVAIAVSVGLALVSHALIETRLSGWLRRRLLMPPPPKP